MPTQPTHKLHEPTLLVRHIFSNLLMYTSDGDGRCVANVVPAIKQYKRYLGMGTHGDGKSDKLWLRLWSE